MQGNIRITNGFMFGLLGGLGVLAALVLGNAIATLASILTYIAAALFIALGLDPIISWLGRRNIKRAPATALAASDRARVLEHAGIEASCTGICRATAR